MVRDEGALSPSHPQIPVYYPGNAAKCQTGIVTNSLFDLNVFIFSTSVSLIQFIFFDPQADLS